MDIDQAYARLDISDRTIDDATILAAFDYHVQEQPSQSHDLDRALTAIAKSRHSQQLSDRLGLGIDSVTHSLSEWPVGIENIGNTCYLNSLLQFYFTIKPLREIVLHIDDYKMPIDDQTIKSKRVGSRNVTKKEVDRAQHFINELQRLFKDLISSPRPSLKPDAEVARLTLLSSFKAEQVRRESMLSNERPSLGTLNGVAIQGPTGPPQAQVVADDMDMSNDLDFNLHSKNMQANDQASDTSSDTLVDGPATKHDMMALDADEIDQRQESFEDKENIHPDRSSSAQNSPVDIILTPPSESPPARITDHRAESPVRTFEEGSVYPAKPHSATPPSGSAPSRPPPLPPANQQSADDALKEAEYGAQQDVNEVIGNVLFQLQCAIKATSIDETGEQLDEVKGLFFGKQKSYITNRVGAVRTKEEYMSDIKVDVASGSRDIYSALDGAFDVQDVEVAGGLEPQYATISQLPPVLQILVQRAQFDPQTKSAFKSNNHLEMKETIYLDRYMDSTDPSLIQRRQECWDWKRQMTVLKQRHSQLATTEVS